MIRWKIAVFEFKRFLKWKQELATLAIMLVIIASMSAWPQIKGWIDKDYRVAVVGDTLPAIAGYQFTRVGDDRIDEVQANLGKDWDLLLIIRPGELKLVGEKSTSWLEKLTPQLQRWHQQQLIAALPLSAEQQKIIDDLPTVDISYTRESLADEKARKLKRIVGIVYLSVLVTGFFASFGLMFTAITGEKQQRVTEQLLTLVAPREWIDGKIIGVSLFSLKTIATYGLITVLIIQGASLISGGTSLSIPLGAVELVCMLGFLIVGILLLNTFLAGFAATIDDPNHSGRTVVMLLPGLLLGAVFMVMDNAEGQAMQLLSWLPLTSFSAMPLRVMSSDVPWWEWLGSLTLLIGFVVWLSRASARVFELGIRMYGKEPRWSDIAAALFNRR
ncbi:ABC transporter permease [Shewanella sp. FJAT-52076]|uniref:ABC transporter permease n=1 Tax=Shewanella sp. FJAT-52076 TaxID=2864202 RepID=UPI001C660A79|nr:ABC transporter permease [Shewanella sp. FJAT-52076]QYJ75575.1 ABC transporter permease [Shewanella sp. FJAT-52076]